MKLDKAMKRYPRLVAEKALGDEETELLAKAFHRTVRELNRAPNSQSSPALGRLGRRLDVLSSDVQRGKLPSRPEANLHILSALKEAGHLIRGHKFGTWLRHQGEQQTDQMVWGAALEQLAAEGRPQSEIETTYQDGLWRFGRNSAYHMAPNAVLQDRSRPNTVRLPGSLLHGLLTSQLLHGDAGAAYFSLDTALRLSALKIPTRFFTLWFRTNRPLTELYTIFMLACRQGSSLKPRHLSSLLGKIRSAIVQEYSLGNRLTMVDAMVRAALAFTRTQSAIDGVSVAMVVSVFCRLVPSLDRYEDDAARMRDAVVDTLGGFLAKWHAVGSLRVGDSSYSQPFIEGMVNGALLRSPELQSACEKCIKSESIGEGAFAIGPQRELVRCAGYERDAQKLERRWRALVESLTKSKLRPGHTDWIVLAEAAVRCNHQVFYDVEMARLRPRSDDKELARSRLRKHAPPFFRTQAPGLPHVPPMVADEFLERFAAIRAGLESISSVQFAGGPAGFGAQAPHMSIDPAKRPLGAEEDVRAIYDEYTTDPSQPPLPRVQWPQDAVVSPTGISLEEIRFRNWVTLTELMAEAEANDARVRAVKGTRLEDLPVDFSQPGGAEDSLPSRDALRSRIFMLRGLKSAAEWKTSSSDKFGFRRRSMYWPRPHSGLCRHM